MTVADFKKVMAGLTDTTPTKDIINAFKVFDKDVRPLAIIPTPARRAHIWQKRWLGSLLYGAQNDGTCNRDELASALCSMGDKLTGDQVCTLARHLCFTTLPKS